MLQVVAVRRILISFHIFEIFVKFCSIWSAL
jgi:hypothetical protein